MHPLPDGAGAAPFHELVVGARDLRPGDFLPPQRALHGSRFQDTGFAVGRGERDVVEVAVLSGRMLLFGPRGTLDSLPVDAVVTVHRRPRLCSGAGTPQG